jgi:cold-inducible RNA-binding protein
MENKVYVGNLPYSTTEEELQELFSSCGEVERAQLITDRDTGRSKGFAFVTFATKEALDSALERNGEELSGRALRINKAQEKQRRF